MIGAILGDFLGSIYEFNNKRTKDISFKKSDIVDIRNITDDSILIFATYESLLKNYDISKSLRYWYNKYPNKTYGYMFKQWAENKKYKPYQSKGNGGILRGIMVGLLSRSIIELKTKNRIVVNCTHNTEEVKKASECIAILLFMIKENKYTLTELEKFVHKNYYNMDFNLDDIRKTYKYSELAIDTIIVSLKSFFESKDYEDGIKNAISVGGDSDTIACITGSLLETYYGLPKKELILLLDKKLDKKMKSLLKIYYNKDIFKE